MLRQKAKQLAFEELYTSVQRSTKVRSIRYSKLEIQPYLQSDMTEEEKHMLTAIRSKCVREIKANFPNMYRLCQHCPLSCEAEHPQEDTQDHVFQCSKLGGSNVDIDFIHAGVVEQTQVAKEFLRLIKRRSTQLETAGTFVASCCLPGAGDILDQSTLGGAASITSSDL